MTNNDDCITGQTYNVGDIVLCTGTYICVPCGIKQHFKQGDILPRCFTCIETNGNSNGLKKGLGLWELIELDTD